MIIAGRVKDYSQWEVGVTVGRFIALVAVSLGWVGLGVQLFPWIHFVADEGQYHTGVSVTLSVTWLELEWHFYIADRDSLRLFHLNHKARNHDKEPPCTRS